MVSKYLTINQFLKAGLLLSLTFAVVAHASVPLSEFFPYSEANGALRYRFSTGHYNTNPSLGFTFRYSNVNYTNVYINCLGALTFSRPISHWWYVVCQNNTVEPTATIALFWARFDESYPGYGKILDQYTNESALLKKATMEIFRAFPNEGQSIRHLFIVTWQGLQCKPEYGSGTNTYQLVLASDGARSFVIYYFNQVQWPKRGNEFEAMSGFIDHRGLPTYLLEKSCSDQITETVVNKSNVNVPGKWIFQVDGTNVQFPNFNISKYCEYDLTNVSRSTQTVKFVSLLGQGVLVVKNKCIGDLRYRDNVSLTCTFRNAHGSTRVAEKIMDSRAICQIPMFNTLGIIDITGRITITDGEKTKHLSYKFPVSVVKNEDVGETLQIQANLINSTLFTIISWQAGSLSLEADEIGIVQERQLAFILLERFPDSSWKETTLSRQILNKSLDESLTNFTFELLSSDFIQILQTRSNLSLLALRYTIWIDDETKYSKQVISNVFTAEKFFLDFQNPEEYANGLTLKCKSWLREEIRLEHPSQFLSTGVISCPNTLSQAELNLRFTRKDVYPNIMGSGASDISFLETVPSLHGYGVRCSYAINGSQIFGAPSGSRFDYIAANSASLLWTHYFLDVLPYSHCCVSNLQTCQEYYSKRTIQTLIGNKYKAPLTAGLYGLAHLTPFGQNKCFTMSGLNGNVWLINHKNDKHGSFFQMQGNLVPFGQSNLTILKAISIQEYVNDELWQVDCACNNNGSLLLIRVKLGTNTEVEFTPADYYPNQTSLMYNENFHILKDAKDAIVITSISGFLVRVISHKLNDTCWISNIVQYSSSATNRFLTTSTGYLFENLRGSDLNETTMNKNRVAAGDSIFIKEFDIPTARRQQVNSFHSPDSMQLISKFCRNQTECMFDYQATGDSTFAKTTYNEREYIYKMKDLESNIVDFYDQTHQNSVIVTKDTSNLYYSLVAVSFLVGTVLLIILMVVVKRYCNFRSQFHTPGHYPASICEENEYAEILAPVTMTSTVAYSRNKRSFAGHKNTDKTTDFGTERCRELHEDF